MIGQIGRCIVFVSFFKSNAPEFLMTNETTKSYFDYCHFFVFGTVQCFVLGLFDLGGGMCCNETEYPFSF